ncbi:type II TA system antitoxin MqsA family protein [Limosilactobacillus sp.]|jgi:putative zinc finger/helix-turn-helix YgiT family protein|uniref:type II TA system antitoxin MqsA family protein n=1 Tax=Limosilactobacillus sp. TaxID=2773925 RepID=UPI0025BAD6FB|nr:type II TA system antitoxin MqsA family protein [Limosilactobacillus sp.]MCH3922920.1 transcriptional regulator [Limosilactobacillus sp.]MCH3927603.1 transcriptional regulator [Limosilactobacillus sp.]
MSYIADYTNIYDIRGHEITITAPARFDDQSHEIIADKRLDDQAAQMALEKFRKRYKVVSPAEIKNFRASWHLSQRKLAHVLGWSPSTVALYEAGAVPTKANNRLLKILMKDKQMMKEFIADSEKDEM